MMRAQAKADQASSSQAGLVASGKERLGGYWAYRFV